MFVVSTQEAVLTNGTPVETSSPASASSLLNRLQLDDDLEADGLDLYVSTETRDLFVTVDDPKKHVSTMETYITYRVSTKVGFSPLIPHLFYLVGFDFFCFKTWWCVQGTFNIQDLRAGRKYSFSRFPLSDACAHNTQDPSLYPMIDKDAVTSPDL